MGQSTFIIEKPQLFGGEWYQIEEIREGVDNENGTLKERLHRNLATGRVDIVHSYAQNGALTQITHLRDGKPVVQAAIDAQSNVKILISGQGKSTRKILEQVNDVMGLVMGVPVRFVPDDSLQPGD